jgi:hypothetical protein
MATPNPKRNADLAMIHVAAKSLFGDVTRNGDGRADYEDWLERLTGRRSASALTADQRIDLIKRLRRDGLIKERGQGGRGEGRPTSEQWAHIAALARKMGWKDGLEDGRLKAFVERTAKVSSARFITREQATAVITGLRRWLASKGEAQPPEGGPHAVS